MTPADRQLVAGLLDAIAGRVTDRDVLLAIAAITGRGCDEAAIGRFTAFLNDTAAAS